MTIRRCGLTVWLCVMAAGCGTSNLANQVSPSSVTTAAPSVGSGNNPQLVLQSIGSCPDGNSPSWLQTWTKGSTARLRWTEVAPGLEYHVIVERYDVTNRYVAVDGGDLFVVNQTWAEVTLSEGRYRARIQTRSCGHFMGPWSESLQFSVEGSEAPNANDAPTSGESAEGTKVPNSPSLTDASGNVWTLGAPDDEGKRPILMNGGALSVSAVELKYHNHAVYAHGISGDWWLYSGGNWINVGPTEP